MRKFLQLALCTILCLFIMFPSQVNAAEYGTLVESGDASSSGDTTYSLYDTDSDSIGDTIVYSGTGVVYGRKSSDWWKNITTVIIEEGVIPGSYAFEDSASITSVSLPDGLTTIEYKAFDGCTGLAQITIPSTVTKGMIEYSDNTWYVANGKIDTGFTGLGLHNGVWYCVQAGKVNMSYSGLVYNGDAWWYVKNGILDTSMTGIVETGGAQWLVGTGKLQSGYTGKYIYNDVTYNIVNGKVK